jgi:hypothetical protein
MDLRFVIPPDISGAGIAAFSPFLLELHKFNSNFGGMGEAIADNVVAADLLGDRPGLTSWLT